jgi:hypothetical protein
LLQAWKRELFKIPHDTAMTRLQQFTRFIESLQTIEGDYDRVGRPWFREK